MSETYFKMKRLLRVKPVDLEKRLKVPSVETGIHSAVRRTLLASRVMGLLPVCGLNQPHIKHLKFSIISPYGLLYIISVIGQIIMGSMAVFHIFYKGFNLTRLTNCLFYTLNMISTFVILYIGKNWSSLVSELDNIERRLPPFPRNVSKICNFIMISVLLLAMVEHLLSVFYGVIALKPCAADSLFEAYFLSSMPWIFEYTTFATWKGILAELSNIQSTFLWTFEDVLIMVISVYLTEHFHIHNDMLKRSVKLERSYADFRTQYLDIVQAITKVNRYIGICVLFSFGGNLFWICMQLFYSLNKNETGHLTACVYSNQQKTNREVEHELYFIFSFSFLVGRAFLVLLLAARIHTASIEPLPILYGVPSSQYDIEVERFIYQINHSKVAITGLDFFYVTKTMILSLIGTIVTYELVLLQFNK